MTEKYNKLNQLTVDLLEKNRKAMSYFQSYSLQETTADFEEMIVPFVNDVKRISDEWITLAAEFVKQVKPKYLHQNQLDDVHENIQIQSVTCFQSDTKRKRFLEQNKSIEYTLNGLYRELTGVEE